MPRCPKALPWLGSAADEYAERARQHGWPELEGGTPEQKRWAELSRGEMVDTAQSEIETRYGPRFTPEFVSKLKGVFTEALLSKRDARWWADHLKTPRSMALTYAKSLIPDDVIKQINEDAHLTRLRPSASAPSAFETHSPKGT